MKTLTDRQEIAKAINLGKYPVLYLDLAKDELKGYEGCYQGQRCKFRNEWNGQTFFGHGNLSYWGDSKELTITNDSVCLQSRFSFYDLKEMVENANATEVAGEQEVVVVIMNSKKELSAYPVLTKTTKYNRNCSTAMKIEGDFSDIINQLK